MASNYKVLGQIASVANTDHVAYTVPTSKTTVISTITVCNRLTTGNASVFRIAVVPSGQVLSDKHYIVFSKLIDIRKTDTLTIGITVSAGDKIYVRADTAAVSFSMFGNEIT